MVDRKLTGRHFHKYLNPQREVDDGAFEVHGLSQAFLSDKPLFSEVSEELLKFIRGTELVIHNAPFDVSFLEYEFGMLRKALPQAELPRKLEEICKITDSLAVARHKHPGQKNNLDALCRRYEVDNSQRQLHGALLDAEILADVYLLMTGGQTQLFSGGAQDSASQGIDEQVRKISTQGLSLKVVHANPEESEAHEAFLDMLDKKGGGASVWRSNSASPGT